MKIKMISLVAAVALSACLFAVAATATGAYFSDSHDGAVAGAGGTIGVATSPLNITWPNMLPGAVYSAAVDYRNDGNNPQDVWVVFPNVTALSALNNLGHYGAVKITDSNTGQIMYSDNLNDHTHDTIVHLMSKYKLASNVAVGGTGTMTFQFQYASMLSSGNGTGFPFNTWPVAGQTFTVPTDGSGTGLPYQIVATQVGIEPGAAGGNAGF